jgi:uncharacterized protein YigE (DUF2233 family)
VNIARTRSCLAAINGGYFDGDFRPVGLRIVDGILSSSPTNRPPLSGYVSVDGRGMLAVTRAIPTADSVRFAMQAGPFLIDPGGTLGIRSSGNTAARRSVIACAGDSIAWIITSEMGLFDLALCLHEQPGAFGLPRVECALNLDGGPSTGLIIEAEQLKFDSEPRGPIRDALLLYAGP